MAQHILPIQGAMLFGKWIPDATGLPKIPIDQVIIGMMETGYWVMENHGMVF